ncbi:MAG: phosphatase PAP2 family protein [Bacteroidetes bacterium]|nr:phosphatase PAP2 family protein [Bacteroidota bacterium]MBK9540966.1 phosphatase PAP2 family protein [Bacteroidota bacterium]
MIDRLIAWLYRLRDRILTSRGIKWLERNYPQFEKFLLDRFSVLHFGGLPLTALVTALGLNILLLFKFTEKVMNSKTVTAIDTGIARYFFSIRSDGFARLVFNFTQVGNEFFIAGLTIVLAVYCIFRKMYVYLIPLLFTVLGSGLTITAGKNVFKKNRPDEFAFYPEHSFSFPSGHSTIAVALYGFLAYLLIRHQTNRATRTAIFLSCISLIGAIGLSRIYLCVHYLSDVIGGYLLGFAWLILAVTFVEWNLRKVKN